MTSKNFQIPPEHTLHEPPPTGEGTIVLPFVLEDFAKRAEMGREKYGTYLRTHNGRDALVDAYQEACDLVMYLKQELLQREERMEKEIHFAS